MTPRGPFLRGLFAALALCAALPLEAFEPELPLGARLTVERNTAPDSFEAPVGVWRDGAVPSLQVEGAVTRRAWRINTPGLTPLQVVLPLRAQIEAAGYEVIFECAARDCGGFDFRFETEILPGPNMYVNLSRYRYLTAVAGPREAPGRVLGVVVSVTAASAYVQVIAVDTGVSMENLLPETAPAPDVVSETPQAGPPPEPAAPAAALPRVNEDNLLERGFVVLRDLEFDTGSTDLGPGPFASLQRLATLLRDRPDLRLALVGHTDTTGGLSPNIAVSRARARSVRQRLVDQYGIDGSRLDAEGMGYLAPVASNLTDAGRSLNRRVEAVLLNSE
ncbi:OmpA family protein [Roseobacter sp.]|uniref:OmpA family protein n=1 Tax=Roseobacter sp. TaxID=1907202 RepID=UPI00260128C6|nr:OmpA family protein [Roseobacter sp.]